MQVFISTDASEYQTLKAAATYKSIHAPLREQADIFEQVCGQTGVCHHEAGVAIFISQPVLFPLKAATRQQRETSCSCAR